MSLEETNKIMREKLSLQCKLASAYINRHAPDDNSYLRGLRKIAIEHFEEPEVVIAFLSGVSGGKSSFLNTAICHYPISPVARVTTSICAVETRRVFSYEDERIEIFLFKEDGIASQNTPVKIFKKSEGISDELFKDFFDYAQKLINEQVMDVNDTLTYFRDNNDEIVMDSSNWRHCMVLLMILLDTYVYQDKQVDPDTTVEADYQESFDFARKYQNINSIRNKLLEKISIPCDQDYMIRLYWNSEHIPENTVLVDLPGTGSATTTTQDHSSHSGLVANYLQKASSILCFFNENATLGVDTKQNLITFTQSNKIKDFDSSARITFVLHKADRYQNPEDARQGINAFRGNFPEMRDYPVYAVSSYDGEWELQNSNIPLRNLHHAGDYIKNYMSFLKKPPTDAEIEMNQRDLYLKNYPYQLNANSKFQMMNFSVFRNKLITEYVAKIRFLQLIENFCCQILNLQEILDTVRAGLNLYKIAKNSAPDLSKALIATMKKSFLLARDDLHDNFAKFSQSMTQELTSMNDRINKISGEFMSDYAKLNDDINGRLQTKINSLQAYDNGDIPISGNIFGIFGGNHIGKDNLSRLMELSNEVASIDFNSYFKKGFKALEEEFKHERNVYKEFLDNMIECISQFPTIVTSKMQMTLNQELAERNLQGIQLFDEVLNATKKLTEALLQTACDSYILSLRSYKQVYRVMDDTIDRVHTGLNSVLEPYTSGDYAKRALQQFEEFNFFAANIINMQRLSDVLHRFFIEDFQNKMYFRLKWALTGFGLSDSHAIRMTDSMNSLKNKYLTDEGLRQLSNQLLSACTVTENIIQDPSQLEDWYKALTNAYNELSEFFTEGTLVNVFPEIFNTMSNSDWASKSLQIANKKFTTAINKRQELQTQ